MSEYLHPVSRACEEQTANTITALSKSELVFVLADTYDITPPQDDNGNVIHPDDYSGGVTKQQMLELLEVSDETSGFDSEDEAETEDGE